MNSGKTDDFRKLRNKLLRENFNLADTYFNALFLFQIAFSLIYDTIVKNDFLAD